MGEAFSDSEVSLCFPVMYNRGMEFSKALCWFVGPGSLEVSGSRFSEGNNLGNHQ
ncbi:hypothetical protein Pan153_41480 [Gimesia panareensis]|uniref:Uncharacterized protein n=1 Tax=Gimesia panareensis TaxID=2527978 RepID=A0A518FT31_9PLAN|nr:hypothetical protein Pan153_41480 [Gimesia panareensis]